MKNAGGIRLSCILNILFNIIKYIRNCSHNQKLFRLVSKVRMLHTYYYLRQQQAKDKWEKSGISRYDETALRVIQYIHKYTKSRINKKLQSERTKKSDKIWKISKQGRWYLYIYTYKWCENLRACWICKDKNKYCNQNQADQKRDKSIRRMYIINKLLCINIFNKLRKSHCHFVHHKKAMMTFLFIFPKRH